MHRPDHISRLIQTDQIVLICITRVQFSLGGEGDACVVLVGLEGGGQVLHCVLFRCILHCRPIIDCFIYVTLSQPCYHVDIEHILAEAKRDVSVVRDVHFKLQLFGWDQVRDLYLRAVIAVKKVEFKWIAGQLGQILFENISITTTIRHYNFNLFSIILDYTRSSIMSHSTTNLF